MISAGLLVAIIVLSVCCVFGIIDNIRRCVYRRRQQQQQNQTPILEQSVYNII